MKHFKKKNFIWALFWILYSFAGDYARVSMLNWVGLDKGYWYNLLGFSPLIFMGLYNYYYITEKPLRKNAIRAYRISLIAIFYYMLIMMTIAYKGMYLIPVYTAPLGMFMASVVRYLRGFVPK